MAACNSIRCETEPFNKIYEFGKPDIIQRALEQPGKQFSSIYCHTSCTYKYLYDYYTITAIDLQRFLCLCPCGSLGFEEQKRAGPLRKARSLNVWSLLLLLYLEIAAVVVLFLSFLVRIVLQRERLRVCERLFSCNDSVLVHVSIACGRS